MNALRPLIRWLSAASPRGIDLTHTLRDGALCLAFLALFTVLPGWIFVPLLVLWGAYQWESAGVAARLGNGGWFDGTPPRGWTRQEVGDLLGTVLGIAIACTIWLALAWWVW